MDLILGVKKVKLDTRNRIFVISLLAKYLGLPKGEDSGVGFTIYLPLTKEEEFLTILNEKMTKASYEEIKKGDLNRSEGQIETGSP